MSGIAFQDRVLMLGRTGCGKSTAARAMFLSAPGPRLVVDPADSKLTDIPGCAHVYGPRENLAPDVLAQRVADGLERVRDAETIRFVPGQPTRGHEYDSVYRWAFNRFPRRVWLDEAGIAAPANGCPEMITAYLVQGRKRQLGHQACHTRAMEISLNLIAQAQHILLWELPHPDDRDRVAKVTGIPVGELTRLMAELPAVPGTTATGFLWWRQADRTITVCPPVPAAA